MDMSDIAGMHGTFPKDNNPAIIAAFVVLLEGGRSLQSLMGDDRFSSPYGGEMMAATYTGMIGLIGSILTKHPLPLIAAALTIAFFIVFYHYQEHKAYERH